MDEPSKVLGMLTRARPGGAVIGFEFEGRLHVQVDVHQFEGVLKVEGILPILAGCCFATSRLARRCTTLQSSSWCDRRTLRLTAAYPSGGQDQLAAKSWPRSLNITLSSACGFQYLSSNFRMTTGSTQPNGAAEPDEGLLSRGRTRSGEMMRSSSADDLFLQHFGYVQPPGGHLSVAHEEQSAVFLFQEVRSPAHL